MPRRTSSRLRGGAAPAASAAAAGESDGEGSCGGGGGGGCPFPPSPGKRKARSPVEEDHGQLAAGLANPHPLRSPSFQSPKKRVQGIGDRFSAAPFDKENDLHLSSGSGSGSGNGISLGGGMFSAPLSADGGAAGAFRLSAFSAFSQHASPRLKNEQSRGGGGRRRGRAEETAADALQSTAAAEAVADAPSTPRVPSAGPAGKDSSMLPFLLAPASVTSSPDLRRKASSRRAPRSTRSTNTNSNSSSSSSSSFGGIGIGTRRSREGSSPSPPLIPPLPGVPSGAAAAAAADGAASPAAAVGTSSPRDPSTSTPRKGRYSFRSGAGCAAGGRRSATIAAAAAAAATSSSAESMSAASPTEVNSGGGGPAGSYRRAVGGGRLGAGGGGGGDTMSDHSPRRSPVHCLTESLQKWDPGSRYASPADDNNNINIEERGAGAGGDGDEGSCAAAGGGGAATGVAGATTKEVGASWNGQELRRTLEKERMGRGRRRRHSITSAQDMYPQARFGDHSPISPASSAASIALEGFDASPPASAGRPWRSSPRRVEGVGGGGAGSGGGSGRRASDGGSSGSGSCRRGAGDEAVGSAHHFGIVRMEGSWSDDDTGPSGTVMKLAFSPRKVTADARTPTTGGKGLTSPQFSVESPTPLSKSGDSSASTEGTAEESHHPASPEQPSLGSMRDLMDEGTDDDEEGGGGGTRGGGGGDGDSRAALVRRRRRRPRPEVALRTLEMPDAMDTEGDPTAAATATAAAGAESSSATAAAASKSTPNPLVSPAAFAGKHLGGGGGAGFGSGCTTARRPWEGPAPLESSSICTQGTPGTAAATAVAASSSVTTADDSWIRERGSKGKGRGDWGGCSTSSAFGAAAEDAQQNVSGGEGNSSGMMTTLGLSGLSGLADTSGASEASTSFVKSRPIPDQSAFTSSRFTKVGAHSPLVGSSGGGPAPGGPAAPVCLTPRKSMMRCPPTPQRTPTWESEDSLLLEGAGSGGGRAPRGGGISAGGLLSSSRSCLLQSKLLASSSSDDGIVDASGGGGGGGSGGGGTGLAAIDVVLANASSSSSSPGGAAARRSSPRLEAAAAAAVDGGGPAAGTASGSGGRYDGSSSNSSSSFGGASGRGGRGRGGRERLSAGGTNTGGRGGGSRFASVAEPAPAVDPAASSGGSGVVVGAGASAAAATDSTLGFKHDFVQMGPIGEGGFSVVWKVRAKGTGRLYAIKRSKREFRGRRDRDRCLLEAKALQRLGQHPGVLRFERAWQEEGHFCLQTELCELGTLKDFLERLPSRREIPEPAVWQVLQDIGQALSHVHAMGLVHLDVKPSNLLIGDEGGRLKLADFGMATAYGEGVEGTGDGQEGDTLYMAKELLSSTARLPSADMFSLGLTVYEVATRIELPGDGEDWHAMRDGRAVGLPSSRSRDLGDVLRQLMHPDPRQRPTADALCEHPRVANVTDGGASGKDKKNAVGGKPVAPGAGAAAAAAAATARQERDDYVVSQARVWRAAEAAAMDHPSSGLRTPTGDMFPRYIFQQAE